MKYLIRATKVSKKYADHTALDRVTLKVPKGKITGLLGPNGAGKTSLLRILNGIILPDSGKVLLEGGQLEGLNSHKIGYLPEERGLYRKMKIQDQLVYLAQLKGLQKIDALEKSERWLEKFDLMEWKDRTVEELSKGMAQKIQFISTVLHEPQLLILDEPFSGFDPINAQLIKQELLRMKEEGCTIILSTHNMSSVEELCDHVVLLNRGRKVLEGSLEKIKSKYKKNEFEIIFDGNMISFTTALWTAFELIHHETLENKSIKVRVAAADGQSINELVAVLLPSCKIWSVTEFIPSMHDVFLQAVGVSNETEI